MKNKYLINRYIIRQKCIATISIALIMISVGLQTVNAFNKEEKYEIKYEYINTKDMAQANIKTKVESSNNKNYDILDTLIYGADHNTNIKDLNLTTNNSKVEEVDLPTTNKEEEPQQESQPEEPKRIWYLPTEMGIISQNPHYGHAAYDIISPRGANEDIYPVANGVISNIYTDSAGALVITILHDINGVKYTSQYAHLSRYADGLYIGKEVTVNDSLGKMGTTGNSTGVHLHFTIVDCALFDPNDTNCSDLNKFFYYNNAKASQGYLGLGSLIYVPGEWSSR